jgi:hypothetical protein
MFNVKDMYVATLKIFDEIDWLSDPQKEELVYFTRLLLTLAKCILV